MGELGFQVDIADIGIIEVVERRHPENMFIVSTDIEIMVSERFVRQEKRGRKLFFIGSDPYRIIGSSIARLDPFAYNGQRHQ